MRRDITSTSGNAYTYNSEYVALLDPQSLVEDVKLEDGSLQKTTKTATNEDNNLNDSKLNGDHVKLGKDPLNPTASDAAYLLWRTKTYGSGGTGRVGYSFSTFDANADGLVELPVVTDSKTITTASEYPAVKVQRQTIMHEMGHAVGIRNPEHPCDESNVMCVPVIGWNLADKFSASAKAQIIIHNKTE